MTEVSTAVLNRSIRLAARPDGLPDRENLATTSR